MWCKLAFGALALWESAAGLLLQLLGVRDTKETPVLTYEDNAINKHLVAACTRLRCFHACPWASGAAAQMVVANLKSSPMRRPFARELLVLDDGVRVALDWQHAAPDAAGRGPAGADLPEDAPLVVCAHGLGGDSTSTYLRVFAELCRSKGWRCVVYNRRCHARVSVLPAAAAAASGWLEAAEPQQQLRGRCGKAEGSWAADGELQQVESGEGAGSSGSGSGSGDEDEDGFVERATSPEALEVELLVDAGRGGGLAGIPVAKIFPKHSDIEDMEQVVAHIVGRFPAAPKLLVGFSAGSNLVVQYCGTANTPDRNPFLAAVSISNAHNLMTATRLLKQRPLSDALMTAFFQEKLAEGLKDIRALAERSGVRLNFARLMRTRHFREFEELMLLPIYNYATLDDYYREVSSFKDFQHVNLPLLSLGNMDDPIIHHSMTDVAVQAARSNPHIISVVTRRGGHLGWQHGWRAEPWMHELTAQFIEAVLRRNEEL